MSHNWGNMNSKLLFVYLSLPLFFITSCRDASIHTYSVVKETSTQVKPAFAQSADIHWKAPSHWIQGPASGMRLASFILSSPYGTGDVSIISLPSNSGSLLANINRWRGQIGLSPTTQDLLNKDIAHEVMDTHEVTIVTLKGDEKSIVAGIFEHGGYRYFVKIIGPSAVIQKETAPFMNFMRGISFDGH